MAFGLVSLGYNSDAIEAPVTVASKFVPFLNIIMFAVDILELAGIIPDPIALLIGLFNGRPREQASLEQAGRLMNARNPAARQAGIMLERMVKEWDIVTSESGSGRVILDAWAHLFVTNLTAQGVALGRAQEILVNATSEAAQTGLPLEPELQQPLPAGMVYNGPQTTLDALIAQYQKAISNGLTISNALQRAEGYIFKTYGLKNLFDLQIGDYIPPSPPPNQVLPSQDGSCPANYALDPTSQMCVLTSSIGGGGGGTLGGGGGGGGGTQADPEGDEITYDLCLQLGGYFAELIAALPGMSGGGGGTDPECCANVVNALANITVGLSSVASAVASAASLAGTPVDLTGVTDALNALVSAVGSIPTGSSVDLAPIVDALNAIAKTIPTATGTDVSGIVDQLKAIVGQGDVDQAIFEALQQAGLISPADLQTLQGLKWSDALSYITGSTPVRTIENLIKRVGADADTAKGDLAKLAVGVGIWAENQLAGGIKATGNVLLPLIENVLQKIIRELTPTGPVSPGAIGVDPDVLLSQVAAVMLTLHVIATTVSLLCEGAGEPLVKTTEKITGILGFEELREVQLGPLIRNGIAAVAEMNARQLYRQTLPGAGQVTNWHARGIIGQAQERAALAYEGYNDIWMPMQEAAAYHGMQARILVRLSETGLFSQGDLVDELTFGGMRPASQQRFLRAAPWIATTSERNQLRGTLEKAYIDGLLADADLAQQIDQLNQDTDRDALIMARVQLEKRIAFTKQLEAAYRQEFTIGLIPEPQYRGLLAGIGLQADFINARVAADQAHMAATAYRKDLAAELALERATAAEERRAAAKNFTSGNVDAAGLAAALLLTGLNPTQAAAWVDLAVLEKNGGLKLSYGQLLPRAEADLRHARVTALSDQRKRLQITEPAFLAGLQALGIPPHFLNSINAQVNAMISPKTAAVVIPVQTG